MIRKAILFSVFILFTLAAHSKNMQVFFSYGTYYSPKSGPYIESYIKIPSNTLKYKQEAKLSFTASAIVDIYLLKGDTVKLHKNYKLQTLPMADTLGNAVLLDLKRYPLPNGTYELILQVQDENDTASKAQLNLAVSLNYDDKLTSISDIMLLDSVYPGSKTDEFTRYGYNLIPAVATFYPPAAKKILFFSETYNPPAGAGDNLIFLVSLKDEKGNAVPGFSKTKTVKNQYLIYFFDGFDIENLPGGYYFLSIELKDAQNKIWARKSKHFVRVTDSFLQVYSNQAGTIPGVSVEYIRKFVPFMVHKLSQTDIAKFTRYKDSDDTMQLKRWFYGVWEEENAEDPGKAFYSFAELVNYVQANFKTQISEGYKTDRGRIYLKYGKPDYLAPYIDEPNAYPYEIWHYYKTDKKNNVKFIFYNPSQMHNDYILLHSEMPGERNNPNWKKMIYQRSSREKNIDKDRSPGNYGDDLDKRFKE